MGRSFSRNIGSKGGINNNKMTEMEQSLVKFIEEQIGIKYDGETEKDALQFIGTYYREAIRLLMDVEQ